MLRPLCLNGIATMNLAIMQKTTTFWPENKFTFLLDYCRVPSSEIYGRLRENAKIRKKKGKRGSSHNKRYITSKIKQTEYYFHTVLYRVLTYRFGSIGN